MTAATMHRKKQERGWDAVRVILAILAMAPLVGAIMVWVS